MRDARAFRFESKDRSAPAGTLPYPGGISRRMQAMNKDREIVQGATKAEGMA
jgi:hypothetical protein